MRAGELGAMLHPGDFKSLRHLRGIVCAVDNGTFSSGRPWSEVRWLNALERWRPLQPSCLFAVVPDVMGDAERTAERWTHYAPVVRELGYRLAYVTQDGLDVDDLPWNEFEALFTGGTDAWKWSARACEAVAEANARSKWTHCGRVNSLRRLRIARDIGYHSSDGTFIARAPDTNLGRARVWFDALTRQPNLWQ